MDTKQEIIRRYFRENDHIRKISRDLKISRQSVRGTLEAYIESKEATDSGLDPRALQEYVSSPPKYDSSNRFKRKLTAEVEDLIQNQLDDNQRKRQEGLRKQIKRKIDIHEYLLSQGVIISYTAKSGDIDHLNPVESDHSCLLTINKLSWSGFSGEDWSK